MKSALGVLMLGACLGFVAVAAPQDASADKAGEMDSHKMNTKKMSGKLDGQNMKRKKPSGKMQMNESGAVPVRTPVLLELFTSEGCSSCPPADQLLEKLDYEQPVSGAELVVLSEHVDYWNHLGWSDPYSLPLFSARQQTYDQRLSTSEVYTPQLVIDGAAEALGSDRTAVLKAVARSLARPKATLEISTTKLTSGVMIHVSAPVPVRLADKATLSIILAMDSARSSVTRGENRGRSLNHVAVAYSVVKAGEVSGDAGISRDVQVSPRPGAASSATRVIAVLQDRNGEVAGVSETRF